MQEQFPTGTVTFLFTDIEGSTKLWEYHSRELQGALANLDITCLNKEFFNSATNCTKEIGYTSATAARADALTSAGLNKIRDGNDAAVMDQISWRATMGDRPMPVPEWKKAQWANGDISDNDGDE